jgi:hypothetical protein
VKHGGSKDKYFTSSTGLRMHSRMVRVFSSFFNPVLLITSTSGISFLFRIECFTKPVSERKCGGSLKVIVYNPGINIIMPDET